MKNGKMILYVGLFSLVIGLYFSVKMTVLILVLGLLFVPPVVALVSTIYEGINVLLQEYVKSRNESFVVYPKAGETQ